MYVDVNVDVNIVKLDPHEKHIERTIDFVTLQNNIQYHQNQQPNKEKLGKGKGWIDCDMHIWMNG